MKSELVFHYLNIEIPTIRGGTDFYTYGEIMYIVYDKPYSVLHCMHSIEKKKYPVQISLAKIYDQLPKAFFQCNQATIINFFYLKEYNHQSNMLIMRDKNPFALPRRRIGDFEKCKTII